jgi:hypothetical protein
MRFCVFGKCTNLVKRFRGGGSDQTFSEVDDAEVQLQQIPCPGVWRALAGWANSSGRNAVGRLGRERRRVSEAWECLLSRSRCLDARQMRGRGIVAAAVAGVRSLRDRDTIGWPRGLVPGFGETGLQGRNRAPGEKPGSRGGCSVTGTGPAEPGFDGRKNMCTLLFR